MFPCRCAAPLVIKGSTITLTGIVLLIAIVNEHSELPGEKSTFLFLFLPLPPYQRSTHDDMAKELKTAFMAPNNEIRIDTVDALRENRNSVSGEEKPAMIKLWIRYASTRQ